MPTCEYHNISYDSYGCFQKYGYPQIIHFNKVLHYKPSILGYPYFWKHPYLHEIYINIGFHRISALEQLELRLDTKWLPFLEIPLSWGVTSPEHLWIPCFANILLFFFFDSQTFLAFFWVEPQTWSLCQGKNTSRYKCFATQFPLTPFFGDCMKKKKKW